LRVNSINLRVSLYIAKSPFTKRKQLKIRQLNSDFNKKQLVYFKNYTNIFKKFQKNFFENISEKSGLEMRYLTSKTAGASPLRFVGMDNSNGNYQ
jgi:hypothetical protein